jgi:hypothetical protein
MPRGLIGKALTGAAQVAVPAAFEQMRANIMTERDQRLAEIAKQSQQREFEHRTSERVAGEKALVDLETGVRQPFIERQREAGEIAAAGLQKTRLESEAERQRLDREVQREGQAITSRQVTTIEQGAALDNQIKEIQIKNAKDVENLRKEYPTATPERKKVIGDTLSILTGKDTDKFLPVPAAWDEMGKPTHYLILNTREGSWTNPPVPGNVDPLGLRSSLPKPAAAGATGATAPPVRQPQKAAGTAEPAVRPGSAAAVLEGNISTAPAESQAAAAAAAREKRRAELSAASALQRAFDNDLKSLSVQQMLDKYSSKEDSLGLLQRGTLTRLKLHAQRNPR